MRAPREGDALRYFAAILDSIAEQVTVQDLSQTILWANRAAAAFVGMSREDVQGQRCFKVYRDRQLACDVCPVREAIEAKEARESQVTTPDGRTWMIRGYPLFDAEGVLCGAAEVTLEATDLQRSREALHDSQERLEAILHATRDGILIADAETKRLRMANPSMCRLLGYEAEEVLNLRVHDIHPPEHVKRVAETFDRQLRREMQVARDMPLLRKDGTILYTDINARPIEVDGRTMVLGVFRDVTDRRSAEAAIRGRDAVLEAVGFAAEKWMRSSSWLDCLEQVLARIGTATDASRVFVVENRLAVEGGPLAVVRHTWPELGPKSRAELAWSLARLEGSKEALTRGDLVEVQAFPSGAGQQASGAGEEHACLLVPVFVNEAWWGVIGVDRSDGELAWSAPEKDALRTAAGLLGAAVQRGIAEQERVNMQLQLLHAQKMEAIGTLAGGVSHDFNNLMTVVRGYVDLAKRQLGEGDAMQPLLERISTAASRAADLTRQLLLFTRKEPGTRRAMDLNEVVKGMGDMLHRLLPESITVVSNLHDGPLPVSGDRGNLEQVVVNLAVNARDAMPDGGELRLSTSLVTISGSKDRKARAGTFAKLTVMDTGIGMEPSVVQRAFEPFYTTKAPGHGTGLGLSTVYGIVSAHDGWIDVCSTPGGGSAFHVFLPADQQMDSEEAVASAIPRTVAGGGERVLVVEDEASVRDFVGNALRLAGYAVVEVESCAAAERAVEVAQDGFHLVLSDVVLPDGNGMSLVEKIKARHPDMRVILTSGYLATTPGTEESAADTPFLQKPYTLQDLLSVVRATLAPGGA